MLKDAGPTELLAAIRAVRDGDSVVAPSATRRLIERFIPRQGEGAPTMTDPKLIDSLSDREREVLTCVGEGLTNTEIAERSGTSCPNSTCATGSPWSSLPTTPDWFGPAADLSDMRGLSPVLLRTSWVLLQ